MTPRRKETVAQALLVAAGLCVMLAPKGGLQPPKLVLLLVVDQLRADYLDRFQGHYRGGLRWLLDHGARFTEAAYRHSGTVTGAGHATVATGLHPASHGIVGNSWRETGRGAVYCVGDEDHPAVGGSGRAASPRALLAPTLGDRLKAKHAGSKVYAFSTKDRSAILLAGSRADGAYWYEPTCGCFVGSAYYAGSLPTWLAEFNAGRPAAAYSGSAWTRLLEDFELYETLARSDPFPGEGDGAATEFPHQLPNSGVEEELAATPFSDELTLGAALALLRSGELGTDDDPDLLALGFSATDSIGHKFGPFSQEAMDNHLRLDRLLDQLIDALEEEVGLDNVALALTADHGVVPLVEHLRAQGVDAQRFDARDLWERAKGAIEACAPARADDLVAQAGGTGLYWNEEALQTLGIARDAVSACLAAWLRSQPGVADVFTADELARRGGDGLAALFENSHFEGRSAHVRVHLREYLYPGGQFGTGHGSAHAYDRRVPVLLAGPGFVAGEFAGNAGPEDIAPTLSKLLGIQPVLEDDTRVLAEALR